MYLIDLFDRTIFGASMTEWLAAAATLAGVYVALALLRHLLARRLGAMAQRTATDWDDLAVAIIKRTRRFFLALIAVHAAARVVEPSPELWSALRHISVIAVLLQTGIWGNGLIGFGADRYTRKRAAADAGTRATIQAVGYAGRFVLWALLVVMALDNFGIDVTTLVTGLGIGGIAIALAVQNILGDLFAALAIVLDKPFVVGDTIHIDNTIGTVEHIGLKTTRLRSLGGEQVVIANNDLLKSRIRNYRPMQERRVSFHLDVTYDTTPEKVARVPEIVRDVIQTQPLARFDRCHFLTFAESALRIEAVYFVSDPDYTRYADTQHAINIELLRRFRSEAIEFAFATRTLYLNPAPGARI